MATTNARDASPAYLVVQPCGADSEGSPAATGGSYESHLATIFSDGSTPVQATQGPAAAGVDAVLASEDLGNFF